MWVQRGGAPLSRTKENDTGAWPAWLSCFQTKTRSPVTNSIVKRAQLLLHRITYPGPMTSYRRVLLGSDRTMETREREGEKGKAKQNKKKGINLICARTDAQAFPRCDAAFFFTNDKPLFFARKKTGRPSVAPKLQGISTKKSHPHCFLAFFWESGLFGIGQ